VRPSCGPGPLWHCRAPPRHLARAPCWAPPLLLAKASSLPVPRGVPRARPRRRQRRGAGGSSPLGRWLAAPQARGQMQARGSCAGRVLRAGPLLPGGGPVARMRLEAVPEAGWHPWLAALATILGHLQIGDVHLAAAHDRLFGRCRLQCAEGGAGAGLYVIAVTELGWLPIPSLGHTGTRGVLCTQSVRMRRLHFVPANQPSKPCEACKCYSAAGSHLMPHALCLTPSPCPGVANRLAKSIEPADGQIERFGYPLSPRPSHTASTAPLLYASGIA
jgi:hypothetical protein